MEDVTDGIVAEDSSPTLTGLVARNGTGIAVNLTGSAGVLRDTTISGFETGLRVGSAAATLENVSVSGSSGDGIPIVGGSPHAQGLRVTGFQGRGLAVVGASGVFVSDVRIGGGNYSLRAAQASNLVIDKGSFGGALVRAVDLADSAASLVNLSIASV